MVFHKKGLLSTLAPPINVNVGVAGQVGDAVIYSRVQSIRGFEVYDGHPNAILYR